MVCPNAEGLWAQWLASVCCSFSEAHTKPLSVNNAAIVQAFDDVFETNTTLCLKRFSTLRNLLPSAVLLPRIAESLQAALPATEHMTQTALCSIYNCHPQSPSQMHAAKTAVDTMTNGKQACVQRHLYEALKRQPFKMPDDFILTEDQDVKTERDALHSTVLKLRTAHDQLSNIEGVFGIVTAGQMARVPGVMHSAEAVVVQIGRAEEGNCKPVHVTPWSPVSTESVHSAAVIAAEVDGQPASPAISVSEGFVHVD